MKLIITFKNGIREEYSESQMDTMTWTIHGHASKIIDAWANNKDKDFIYMLSKYAAFLVSEVVSIRLQ